MDAPCSVVSVTYSPEGVGRGPEFFETVSLTGDRGYGYHCGISHTADLVAGMGDALATFYEARTCFRNPSGKEHAGGPHHNRGACAC